MKAKINLITIWTDDIITMKQFYQEELGFIVKTDLGDYVEFNNEGVRFAICLRSVMYKYSNEFNKKVDGQHFELAFECTNENAVNMTYERLISGSAKQIAEPEKMPWGQYTALFADPDGNIHEIFCEI